MHAMNVFVILAHPEPKSFNIDAILRPIQRGIFQFIGFDVLKPQIHWSPVRADDQVRKCWLDEYAARLRVIHNEQPIDVGAY